MHIDIQERTFCNWIAAKGFLSDIGGILVESCNEEKELYRDLIIELIKKIKDINSIKAIFIIVEKIENGEI